MPPIPSFIKNPRIRMRVAYALVLTLGLSFSGLLLFNAETVFRAERQLRDAELPLLDRVAELKLQITQEEAALYDYYITQDRTRFMATFDDMQARARTLFADIDRLYGNDEIVSRLAANQRELDRLAQRSAATENGRQLTLWAAANAVRDINADLDRIAAEAHNRMRLSTAVIGDTVRHMARLGVLFSVGIFLIALWVGKYITLYMRESAERRRLAVFAERNPNPVMRLSLEGKVIYANAAAHDLARRMDAPLADALLPPDVRERTTSLRNADERYQVWEYDRDGYAFECGIHYLADLESFHLYLADVTQRRQSEEKLVYQAYHHPVTALPNRRMFQEVVEQALHAPEQRGRQAAVFLLDIDRLKAIIDTLGHEHTDDVLRAVAERLRATLEEHRELVPGAVLYHFEADLYGVFVPTLTTDQAPTALAEKLASAGTVLHVGGREFSVRFSIGASIYPDDGIDTLGLLKNADSALHGIKRQGGDGFRMYKPEMNAIASNWLSLESYLRHAIEREELRLYYQPQIDVRRSRVVGVEALLRWQHPERGLLGPKDFIGIAEESGLIDTMGEWALRRACEQAREWAERGLLRTTMAVNISGRQFHRQDLPCLVSGLLADTGLPPDCLELEITESVTMHDVERTTTMLHELKGMGVRLAIDDFGTGFSSLAYLQRFPIDKLKIDRSFVQGVGADGTDATIAHAIVSLGHALKLTVCAEGVETRAQLARLRQSQCDQAQGMLYSEPLPAEQMEPLLRGGRGGMLASLRPH